MLRYVPNTPQTEVYDRVRSEAEKVMNSRDQGEQNPKNVVAGTTAQVQSAHGKLPGGTGSTILAFKTKK
jgi:hypothetical protein